VSSNTLTSLYINKPLTMVLVLQQHHKDIFSIARKNLHPWINELCLEANDVSAERRTVIDISRGITVHATHRDHFIAYTGKKKKSFASGCDIQRMSANLS
jgi:hypothetical protein